MAFSEAETIRALDLLGLAARNDVPIQSEGHQQGLRDTYRARKLIEAMNADQETLARGVLTEFAKVEFDSDELNAQGLDSSAARQRRLLAGKMARYLGFTRPLGDGLSIRRG